MDTKTCSVWARWVLAVGLLAVAAPSQVFGQKNWREYNDCRLIPNDSNDADSFHVRAGNRRPYIFRLYFVDAPESDNSLPDRLQEQAEYFGIADIKDVVKAGKEATRFAESLMKDGFRVYSRLADARGRSDRKRNYAMVLIGDKDLGMELVRNGYARIHGMPTDLRELAEYRVNENTWWQRLRAAENEAKREKRGAWAYAGGSVSRLDALFAPRQVEPQEVVLSTPLTIYPSDPSATHIIGRLNPGVTVQVLRGISPDRAAVRFTTSNGQTYEGSARFIDLGL